MRSLPELAGARADWGRHGGNYGVRAYGYGCWEGRSWELREIWRSARAVCRQGLFWPVTRVRKPRCRSLHTGPPADCAIPLGRAALSPRGQPWGAPLPSRAPPSPSAGLAGRQRPSWIGLAWPGVSPGSGGRWARPPPSGACAAAARCRPGQGAAGASSAPFHLAGKQALGMAAPRVGPACGKLAVPRLVDPHRPPPFERFFDCGVAYSGV